MRWTQESGFLHSQACFNYTQRQVAKANSELAQYGGGLDLLIVDACCPDQYQQNRRVLVTNNWLAPGQLNSDRYEQFPNTWYGLYAGEVSVESIIPTKKFNCFINRMDPIRQSWFYQLLRRDIFDQGFVSFNMDISRHAMLDHCKPTGTPHQLFEHQFQQYLQLFQEEHEIAKTMVPYRNFDADLNTVIMLSEFSIVLETYFDRNEIITFSEKIFRCLKLPRPWVMFAMKNAVSHLRELGFDVLDDLVNHIYDGVDFAIERQTAVLNQIEIMCRHTLTESEIRRCERAADHNQRLLLDLYDRFHKGVNTACENAKVKFLKL
jgi:hypothetical protein